MSVSDAPAAAAEEPTQTHIPVAEPEPATTEELLAKHLPCPLAELTPLNIAVMRNQATINIGTIGHVAHGKTTAVKAISGVHTIKHSHEKIRNITIKLGYANAKIYKCMNPSCPRPTCYKSYGSAKEENPMCLRPGCGFRMQLVRHVSFIDCPGHEILTATMLTGSAVMDAALLLIAANETCPQPQTKEHLAAVEVMKLSKVLILQNKLDLLKDEEAAKEHHRQILEFVKGTVADGSPVIPMSAQLGYNIDILLEQMVTKIPIPTRNFVAPPRLIVIRSFDVNKPGTDAMELQGGVAGGSLLEGVLVVGQEIELRPGYISRDPHTDKYRATPIFSRIVSLKAEENNIDFAVPGGLIGVGTMLDPSLCRADNFVGQVLGAVGHLPEVYGELEATCFLMRRVLGTKTEGSERQARVAKLERGETLQLNIGSQSTPGKVLSVRTVVSKEGAKTDFCTLQLSKPVCTVLGDKIAFSRKIDRKWRLIGWGEIQQGALLKR